MHGVETKILTTKKQKQINIINTKPSTSNTI